MSKIEFQDFQNCGNWINNQTKKDEAVDRIKIISPYFDKQIATIPNSDGEDLNQAVEAASNAFRNWSRTNIRDRAQTMFRFKSIIESDIHNLSSIIALDNGKTIDDALGSIKRGIEVIDFAISMPNILKGESVSYTHLTLPTTPYV